MRSSSSRFNLSRNRSFLSSSSSNNSSKSSSSSSNATTLRFRDTPGRLRAPAALPLRRARPILPPISVQSAAAPRRRAEALHRPRHRNRSCTYRSASFLFSFSLYISPSGRSWGIPSNPERGLKMIPLILGQSSVSIKERQLTLSNSRIAEIAQFFRQTAGFRPPSSVRVSGSPAATSGSAQLAPPVR